MDARWGVLAALLAVACEPTTLEVVNRSRGATLDRVRWVGADGKHSLDLPSAIAPGGSSAPVAVYETELYDDGRLRFDLVLNGARVQVLRTQLETIEEGKALVVEVRDDDEVENASLP